MARYKFESYEAFEAELRKAADAAVEASQADDIAQMKLRDAAWIAERTAARNTAAFERLIDLAKNSNYSNA